MTHHLLKLGFVDLPTLIVGDNDERVMDVPFVDLLVEMAETPAGPPDHHGEGSVLVHTTRVVDELESFFGTDPPALCAAFFHDIGKVQTPTEELPNHYDHVTLGAESIAANDHWFSDPQLQETARVVAEQHMRFKKLPEMSASRVIRLVETIDET